MELLSERIRNVMDGLKGQDDEKRIALAEIAGVSTLLVEKWLNDRSAAIDYRCSKKIAEKLGYRTDWLMRGIGPVRQKKSVAPVAVGETHAQSTQPVIHPVAKSDDLFLTHVTDEEMRLLTFCRIYPEAKQTFLEIARDITNNQA